MSTAFIPGACCGRCEARKAKARTARRMGRAQRNPSPGFPKMMGFAALYPSYALSLRGGRGPRVRIEHDALIALLRNVGDGGDVFRRAAIIDEISRLAVFVAGDIGIVAGEP